MKFTIQYQAYMLLLNNLLYNKSLIIYKIIFYKLSIKIKNLFFIFSKFYLFLNFIEYFINKKIIKQ